MAHERLGAVLRQMRTLGLRGDAAGADDLRLLERFVNQRDEAAFEALLRRHGPMVLGICRRLLPDPDDAEDAFQATFLVLLKKARSLARRELLANWLYGVAYRTALQARGRAARRRARQRPLPAEPEAESPEDPAGRDLRRLLDDEVSRLPWKYRVLVVACYLQGKTLEEAARSLGWPVGTVSGRLARARDLLRRRLTRRGAGPSAGLLAAVLSPDAAPAVPPSLAASARQAATTLLAGGTVSTPAGVLMKGVLQAMFLTRLKTTVVVLLALGFLTSAAGAFTYAKLVARQEGGKKPPEARPAVEPQDKQARRPEPPVRAQEKLQGLLKARLQAAKTEVETRTQEFQAGRCRLDIMLAALERLLRAELEMSDRKADRITAYQGNLTRLKQIEDTCQALFQAGRLGTSDMAQATYARLEAEILLERAKAQGP
ncbi:MAG TPA: RNA polymerase sigma factor [Gemmataceae bacterium]|nr:RNA polymerase sigma factor [Gemmataceae bacterium]